MVIVKFLKIWVLLLALMVGSQLVSASINQADNRSLGYVVNDSIFHMWNWHDDYYIDLVQGIQLTNNYNEYWANNTWCFGQNRVSWNYICSDSLNLDWVYYTDNSTLVYLVGYKEVTTGAFKFNFSLNYSLDASNLGNMINITLDIVNTGNRDWSFPLGFKWQFTDIRIGYNYSNNTINLNSTRSLYNLSYTFLDWPGQQIILERGSENIDFEYFMDSNVYVTPGSYNNSDVTVELVFNDGLNSGGSLTRLMRWHDATCIIDFLPTMPADYDKLSDGERAFVYGGCWNAGTGCPVSVDCREWIGGVYRGYCDPANCGTFQQRALWRVLPASEIITSNDYECSQNQNLWYKLPNFEMPYHDNLTDLRVRYYIESLFCPEPDNCFCLQPVAYQSSGQTTSVDVWLDNNTPSAENVTVNGSFGCEYDFFDPDKDNQGNQDVENTTKTGFKWYYAGLDLDLNNSNMILEDYQDLDGLVCCVKPYDNVFTTGNEAFYCSGEIKEDLNINTLFFSISLIVLLGLFLVKVFNVFKGGGYYSMMMVFITIIIGLVFHLINTISFLMGYFDDPDIFPFYTLSGWLFYSIVFFTVIEVLFYFNVFSGVKGR